LLIKIKGDLFFEKLLPIVSHFVKIEMLYFFIHKRTLDEIFLFRNARLNLKSISIWNETMISTKSMWIDMVELFWCEFFLFSILTLRKVSRAKIQKKKIVAETQIKRKKTPMNEILIHSMMKMNRIHLVFSATMISNLANLVYGSL